MKKQLCTLLCASLVSLLGSNDLGAKPTTTSAAISVTAPTHSSMGWMPNDFLRTLSMVQLTITFPYEGLDNEWEISFVDNTTYDRYDFTTNSSTAASGVLGEVPAAVYNVSFQLIRGRHTSFDYFAGCDKGGSSSGYMYGNIYRTTINEQCNTLNIDAYY